MSDWISKYRFGLLATGVGLLTAWMVISRPYILTDPKILGGLIFLELLGAVVWNYRRRFFPALILVFLLAGIAVPMQGTWGALRWLVLGAGAILGVAIFVRDYAISSLQLFHGVALCCVVTAATSAEVSSFPTQPLLKALSLFLLFLYCSFGARLAVMHREEAFVASLLWGCEALIYFTAANYLIAHTEIFGNPNSLGAVMGVGAVPLMLWGVLTCEQRKPVYWRRGFALLLATALLLMSFSRASIVAALFAGITLCVLLRRYRTLIKGLAACLLLATAVVALAPAPGDAGDSSLKSRFVFKGKGEVLYSRKSVWDTAIASIQQHPWFGTGYGTVLTAFDKEAVQGGQFGSTTQTTREHGNSYLAILEGVGLVGVVPFAFLIFLTVSNIRRALTRLYRSGDPFPASVPLALVLLAGLVHATFEDWLFAVGSYICIFFWALAFMVFDLVSRPPLEAAPHDFGATPHFHDVDLVSLGR